jgi:hypothetical protein
MSMKMAMEARRCRDARSRSCAPRDSNNTTIAADIVAVAVVGSSRASEQAGGTRGSRANRANKDYGPALVDTVVVIVTRVVFQDGQKAEALLARPLLLVLLLVQPNPRQGRRGMRAQTTPFPQLGKAQVAVSPKRHENENDRNPATWRNGRHSPGRKKRFITISITSTKLIHFIGITTVAHAWVVRRPRK